MVFVTLGQQYNIGEKPTVILYTYINLHARTPEKQRRQNSTSSNMIVIIYCYIGYKDEIKLKLKMPNGWRNIQYSTSRSTRERNG